MKTFETENHRYLSILKEVHTKITPLISSQVQPEGNGSSAASNSKPSEKSGAEDSSTLNGTSAVSE